MPHSLPALPDAGHPPDGPRPSSFADCPHSAPRSVALFELTTFERVGVALHCQGCGFLLTLERTELEAAA
jgi:hypothetical protein